VPGTKLLIRERNGASGNAESVVRGWRRDLVYRRNLSMVPRESNWQHQRPQRSGIISEFWRVWRIDIVRKYYFWTHLACALS
jgi:hypothetical protein